MSFASGDRVEFANDEGDVWRGTYVSSHLPGLCSIVLRDGERSHWDVLDRYLREPAALLSWSTSDDEHHVASFEGHAYGVHFTGSDWGWHDFGYGRGFTHGRARDVDEAKAICEERARVLRDSLERSGERR